MKTIDKLKEVKEMLKKKVLLEKSPRVNKNVSIIGLVIDGFTYEDIGEKYGVTRQCIGEMIMKSVKLL